MRKRYVILIISVFLLTALLSGNVLAQTQDQTIEAIEFQGNDNVMSEELFTVIESEVGDQFNSENIKNDMQAVYDLGYFQDITVNFQNYEGGLKVIFNVVENPIIQKINIKGSEVYDREQIIEWMGISEGKILNVNNLNEGLQNVITKHQDNGYILVNYADVNVSEDGVLNVVLNLGHINDIILKGNLKTKDYVIFREIDLEKGQVLNVDDLRTASRSIYQLNFFDDINPEMERVSEEDNDVNVIINLTERKTGNFNFGGGYSSRDGWFGFVKVDESNLGGNGQTIGFNYQFGKNDYYTLSFQEPYLMGYDTSFGINLYNRSRSTEDADGNLLYKTDTTGGNVSLGRDIYNDWRGTVRYKMENVFTDYADEATEDTRDELRSITLTARKNTTNYLTNPTDGKLDIFSIEHAGNFLGGDANFTKYEFDLRRYFPGFKQDHSWALRLNGGTSTGILPDYEKYTLGGSDSLRGYKVNTFRGDSSLLTQIEYRIEFMDNLTGVAFVDGGQTWQDGEEIKLDNLNFGKGLGVRLNTPIGQIRLDYGWNDEGKGTAHFSIGSTF